jgi:hypothetical protein
MKAIKNYTTQIATEKSLMEIQKMLCEHGALAVMTEYDEDRIISHVCFRIKTTQGIVPFRLPANTEGVLRCLKHSSAKVPKRLQTREQAARVAWRILKDWIDSQLAIVDAQMVDLEEVFLPYAQFSQDGCTVYERFKNGGLLLETSAGG